MNEKSVTIIYKLLQFIRQYRISELLFLVYNVLSSIFLIQQFKIISVFVLFYFKTNYNNTPSLKSIVTCLKQRDVLSFMATTFTHKRLSNTAENFDAYMVNYKWWQYKQIGLNSVGVYIYCSKIGKHI